jgi:transcriptional regulator with XRE-family HTH domain
MRQPELGKKIAELRRSKGLTQEELVEKCNLNVRTLQRIESGEVTPRSYTVKMIFTALDFPYYNLTGEAQGEFSKAGSLIIKIPGQLYRYFLDLTNLKTHTMKKISVLFASLVIIGIALFSFCSESKAQKTEKAITDIKTNEQKLNNWINTGKVDSVLSLYRDDACVIPFSCGKEEMYKGLKPLIDNGYKVLYYNSSEISLADSIAVEKYSSVYRYMGSDIKQKGMKEWRQTNGKWLIINHMMMDY